ncbi:hypothetical protein GH714_027148 [Hevea brasiliensis]|uniref:Uncharacterized protein n=1 Tax=Hevea brasiliensis TaxID=3981 RepID=A0A6A6N6Y2_HEVBR|nr:hypothetical protein GH714_027148 [Hevea brasiliensis]
MSKDEDDLGSPHAEDMDVGLQTSDKLDLNLDQDCLSPNVAQKELCVEAAEADLPNNLGTESYSAFELMNRRVEVGKAFQFASRQLNEVIEEVEKILTLKPEAAHGITSSSIAANGSESENAEIFLDERAAAD